MRIFLLSFLFLLASPLMAYNVGKVVKPSFGAANGSVENTETAETPRNSYTAKTYSQSRLNLNAQKIQKKTIPPAQFGGGTSPQVPAVSEEQMQALANAGGKTKMAVPKDFNIKPTEEATPSVKKPEGKDSKTPQAAPDQPAIPPEAAEAISKIGGLQELMKSFENSGREVNVTGADSGKDQGNWKHVGTINFGGKK